MKPAQPALRKFKKLLRDLARAMRAGSLPFKICMFLSYAALLTQSVDARVLAKGGRSVPDVQAREAAAVRVERAPVLDGTLNDPLWQLAKPIDDFRQKEPYEGQPATERTEVRILYARDRASLAAANPVQVRVNRFAVKYTHSFAP